MLAIEIVSPDDADALADVLGIYQEAIEPSEQKRAEEIASMARDPRYLFLLVRKGGRVTAFSISMFPAGSSCWLLEYMAVRADGRSAGTGAALLSATYRAGQERRPEATMLLEIDQPGSVVSSGNDPDRRYRFYQRMNCRYLDKLDYLLPLDNGAAPPPMRLITFGSPAIEKVPRERVQAWLEDIYTQVYRKPRSDIRISQMIARLDPSVRCVPL